MTSKRPVPLIPEPITPTAPRPVGRPVFTQTWSDLTFLHWAVDPSVVAPFMPEGCRPDTLDGVTYVGLISFQMRKLGLLALPGIPFFGTFPETNVRLYSVDEQGRRGVVFLSLEAARLAPVLVARFGPGVPYTWATMRSEHHGEHVSYASRRLWPKPYGASSQVTVHVGQEIAAGPVEHFVTARWGLHLVDGRGRTRYWPNEHPQWPLRAAELVTFDDELLPAAGFPQLAGRAPDSVLFSAGVPVTFGRYLP